MDVDWPSAIVKFSPDRCMNGQSCAVAVHSQAKWETLSTAQSPPDCLIHAAEDCFCA